MEIYFFKRKEKKILIAMLAIVFSIAALKGQDNMVIHLAGSNDVTVAIDDIQRITFDGDNMLLKTVTGAEHSYLLETIASITFLDGEPTAIKEVAKNIEPNVYVNASGELIVESSYLINRLTVFDLNGRKLIMGTQNRLNVNALSKGLYLVKIETAEGVVTKKFIKK